MNKSYIKTAILVLFLGMGDIAFSQNISINLSGATSTNPTAILDLSDASNNQLGVLLTNVSLNANNSILPFTSAPATGLIVWNTNAAMTGGFGVGFYYWSGTQWLYIINSGGASSGWNTTGNAGTNPAINYAGTSGPQDFVVRTNAVERMRLMSNGAAGIGTPTPKSEMDVNGNMSLGTYAGITAAPANGMIISGKVGIGNNSPAASAVVDLTNTQATGGTGAPMLWSTNPNPAANIAAPVLGEEVFNSTTGCFNFYNGAAWVVLGCPCTSAPPSATITASCSQSWQGSSITYTSSVTTGVTFSWTVSATTGAPIITAGQGTSSITVTWPSTGANTGTVTLNMTNLCGTTTVTQSVTINPTPTITGSNSIATNSTANAYTCSQAGASYAWSSSTTWGVIVGSTTGQTISVNAGSSPGSFTLTCTVTFGACSQTITYAVSVITCAITHGTATFNPTSATGPTGTIQSWTVPCGITQVTITAYGAAGGIYSGYTPGYGAEIVGTFTVTTAHIWHILVGQQGVTYSYAGGGGGGSFVWDVTSGNTLLIAAGGGGGNSFSANATVANGGGSPNTTPTTGLGAGSGAGGAGGNGGAGGGGTNGSPGYPGTGGGGSGWSTNGANGTITYAAGGGLSPLNGGTGGTAGTGGYGATGGFGGGGGSSGDGGAGGGGGGYNGGGGGNIWSGSQWGNGGGGGSYNGGTSQTNIGGVRTTAGLVTIQY